MAFPFVAIAAMAAQHGIASAGNKKKQRQDMLSQLLESMGPQGNLAAGFQKRPSGLLNMLQEVSQVLQARSATQQGPITDAFMANRKPRLDLSGGFSPRLR